MERPTPQYFSCRTTHTRALLPVLVCVTSSVIARAACGLLMRAVGARATSLPLLRLRVGLSAPRPRATRHAFHASLRVCAAVDGGALRARLAAAEKERSAAEGAAVAALAAARDAGAAADAANREAEAAVAAGDDAAASAALLRRRSARESLTAALSRAETANALRTKLAQLCQSLETDIIAAEAAARPAPPPAPRKGAGDASAPLRPPSMLSDDELSERFIALSSATPAESALEVQLRREMRRLSATDGDE